MYSLISAVEIKIFLLCYNNFLVTINIFIRNIYEKKKLLKIHDICTTRQICLPSMWNMMSTSTSDCNFYPNTKTRQKIIL